MSWFPKKSVVVPIDYSSSSHVAIQTALQLVEKTGDVHVLHVSALPDFVPYGEMLWSVDPQHWMATAEKHMQDYLDSRPEFRGVTAKTVQGDPGTRIAEYATEVKADLIVIPSHGYHGVKRALLGSVAESVLRHSPCEMLILHRNS